MGNTCGNTRVAPTAEDPPRSTPEPLVHIKSTEVQRLEAELDRLKLELQTQKQREDKGSPVSETAEAKSPGPSHDGEETPGDKSRKDYDSNKSDDEESEKRDDENSEKSDDEDSEKRDDAKREEDIYNEVKSRASDKSEKDSEDEQKSQTETSFEDRAVLVKALDDRPAQDIKDGFNKFSEDNEGLRFVQGEGKAFMVIFDNERDTGLQELRGSLESQLGDGAVDVTALKQPSAVYVTDLPSGLHEDHLRLYLESKLGRPKLVRSVELDANAAIVRLEDSSVALKVLEMDSPEVCGIGLQLYPYFHGFGPLNKADLSVPLKEKHVKKAPAVIVERQPEDLSEDTLVQPEHLGFSQRTLLASGVPGTSPASTIQNIVESVSDQKIKKSLLGEKGKVLLIFYEKAPAPEEILSGIRGELGYQNVTLKTLKDTSSVIIMGLSPSLPKTHLRHELQAIMGDRNPTVVESIKYDHDGKDRTIAFSKLASPGEALQLVSISRTKKVNVFQVHLYFEQFGGLDIFEEQSIFRIPGPLSVPIADQQVYQYLEYQKATVERFSDSLRAPNAQVCVSEGELALTASFPLTTGSVTHRQRCEWWRQEIEHKVKHFLQNYHAEVIQVFPSVWPRVMKTLADEDLTTSCTDAEMVMLVPKYKIVVRGCQEEVESLFERVKKIVHALEEEDEVFTENISISEKEARLQEKLDLYRFLQREHPRVFITREQQFSTRNDTTVCISIKGKDKDEVLNVRKKFEQWRDRVPEFRIYTVDDAVAAMYNRKTVQDYIDQLLRRADLHATYEVEGKELKIYSPEVRKGATIQKLVRESVCWKMYHVTIGEMGQLNNQDLEAFANKIEKEFGGFAGREGSPVKVHWRPHGLCVIVISTRQNFNSAIEKFEKFLDSVCSVQGEESSRFAYQIRKVPLKDADEAEFAERFLSKGLNQIQTKYIGQHAAVELASSNDRHFVKVSAPYKCVEEVCRSVEDMTCGISKCDFPLEGKFCRAAFTDASGEAFQNHLAAQHACVLKRCATSSPDAVSFTLVYRQPSGGKSTDPVGEEEGNALSRQILDKLQAYLRSCTKTEEVDVKDVEKAEVETLIQQSRKDETFVVSQEDNKIIIEGLEIPALKVAKEMVESVYEVRERQTLSESVKWKYKGNDGRWQEYGQKLSGEIEQAMKRGKAFTFQRGNESVTVDVYVLEEVSSNGERRPVQRQDLRKANSIEPPDHWAPVKDTTDAEYFEVDSSTVEYKEVTGMFKQTLGKECVIHQVHRVQNLELYQLYGVRRLQMEKRQSIPSNFERDMWHGSDKDTLGIICKGGFNRSYGGRNLMAYGEGSYFAVNSSYSAHPTYSKPDGSRRQRMLRCKVLAGLQGLGQAGMKEPPFIDGASGPRYDSCTDGGNQMCIVFYDNQAYPEYEITFSAQ